MPVLGVAALMAGLVLVYLGYSGTTIGELARSVFSA